MFSLDSSATTVLVSAVWTGTFLCPDTSAATDTSVKQLWSVFTGLVSRNHKVVPNPKVQGREHHKRPALILNSSHEHEGSIMFKVLAELR